MADLLGLKQASINKYEHGNATPVIETLKKYADYFDVSMDYIFARTDNPQGKLHEMKSKQNENKNKKDSERFIEMCFDPESLYHARLKQTLLQMMADSENE